jgi:SPP1 gp7 family putative phage head morphogenesis protein
MTEYEAKRKRIVPSDFRMPFTDEQIELYLMDVHSRAISVQQMDVRYHAKVAVTLEDALAKGFKGSLKDFVLTSTEYQTYKNLRNNIYQFSACKQYQQVRIMSEFINRQGLRSTFDEFKKLARPVFVEYNENYLRTEYTTAIGQSQMAREWIDAQATKDLFPYMEYRTQGDRFVRDEHAMLDGIILPIDDKFWWQNMPKNGYNCRCFTVRHERAKVTDLETRDLSALKDKKIFPPLFRMNPGRDGYVFNPKRHPYYTVATKDEALFNKNFKMPMP